MIIINEQYEIEGSFSFNINIDREKKPPIVSIEGILSTETYIEELKSIRNERYSLNNIEVFSEGYGSDEDDIVYRFTAGSFQRLPREGLIEIKKEA